MSKEIKEMTDNEKLNMHLWEACELWHKLGGHGVTAVFPVGEDKHGEEESAVMVNLDYGDITVKPVRPDLKLIK